MTTVTVEAKQYHATWTRRFRFPFRARRYANRFAAVPENFTVTIT